MVDSPLDPVCVARHETIYTKIEAVERLNKERCDLIVGKIEERLKGMDVALNLKSAELTVRLADLNHVRAEAMRERQEMVRKETYDTKVGTYDVWITGVNDRLTRIETRTAVWSSVIIIVFAVAEVLLHFLEK